MKLDILFALPGPHNAIQGDKLLVVAAATEHEDPKYLQGVIADVAEMAMQAGVYRAIHKVTLELDDPLVVDFLKEHTVRSRATTPKVRVHASMLN